MSKKGAQHQKNVKTNLIIIDVDTNIPISIRQTQGNTVGLHGRKHKINPKQSKNSYIYYYPGILDYLLHIEIDNGVYILPEPYANFLENWLRNKRIKSHHIIYEPVGDNANEQKKYMEKVKESKLLSFIKDAPSNNINKYRWSKNSDLSAIELLNSDDYEMITYIISKIWMIDWSKNRQVTRDLIVNYNLNVDLKSIQNINPTEEIEKMYL